MFKCKFTSVKQIKLKFNWVRVRVNEYCPSELCNCDFRILDDSFCRNIYIVEIDDGEWIELIN